MRRRVAKKVVVAIYAGAGPWRHNQRTMDRADRRIGFIWFTCPSCGNETIGSRAIRPECLSCFCRDRGI